MNLDQAAIVTTFQNHETAEAAASLLLSEGVETLIRSDDAGGELPNLDMGKSIRLLAEVESVEFARGVLGLDGMDASDPIPSL